MCTLELPASAAAAGLAAGLAAELATCRCDRVAAATPAGTARAAKRSSGELNWPRLNWPPTSRTIVLPTPRTAGLSTVLRSRDAELQLLLLAESARERRESCDIKARRALSTGKRFSCLRRSSVWGGREETAKLPWLGLALHDSKDGTPYRH